MATGDQFTNIVEKRIMGYQDFGAYFFDYVRTLLRDAIKKMFTLNGTFGSTKINITSSANDTFRLDSNREGADSYGHIMANSDSGTNYAFQNTAAQTYQVGFKYGEHPVLLAINPRTALPEFTRYEESLGEAAAPNSVVDNGSNLTLVVNSVTEAGVTNAGRSVRVWKVYPGPDATTLAIALETCTVSWNGSNNVITTTGLFGQTTPSTTAADYLVQLVGPTVKRNTDIRTSSYWYIGEVTGNGPAATPVGFDMTDQNIIPFSLSEALDSTNIVSAAISDSPLSLSAGTVFSQITALLAHINDDINSSFVNSAAISDSPSSLSAGTIFAQLTALLAHINDRGRLASAENWTAKQTFSNSVPILLSPYASPSLSSNGDIAYDSTGNDRIIARVDGVNRDIVQAQQSRVLRISSAFAQPAFSGGSNHWNLNFSSSSNLWTSQNFDGSSFYLIIPLNGLIPQGAVITSVSSYILGAGTSSGVNRLVVQLFKGDASMISEAFHDGTATYQWVTISGLTETFDSGNYPYFVVIRAQLAPTGSYYNIYRYSDITFTDGNFARVP